MAEAGTRSATERAPGEPGIVGFAELRASVAAAWRVPDALARIRESFASSPAKLVVIDDDPTGTQTVADVPVLTTWSDDDLDWALSQPRPVVTILTNTRSVPRSRAEAINQDLGYRLASRAAPKGLAVRALSRSDSTLRGHFPGEVDALARGLALAGKPVDGVLLVPAFIEAGRVTVGGVHWLHEGTRALPVATTEFASDPVFGYSTSNLADWATERGRSGTTTLIGLDDLRRGGPVAVGSTLARVRDRELVIADALDSSDLEVLALGALEAEQAGVHLIYRTAPSFVRVRAGQELPSPLQAADLCAVDEPGLVVVGSYTGLTTRQVERARAHHDLGYVEIRVDRLADAARHEIELATGMVERSLKRTHTLLVTSRNRVDGGLELGRKVSDALVEVVSRIAQSRDLGWLVAKGGVTSAEIAGRALDARRATVAGQLFPGGVSVWHLGAGSRMPGAPYVVFPGNVGDDDALRLTINRLIGRNS